MKLLITNDGKTDWSLLLNDYDIVDDLSKADIIISLKWAKLSITKKAIVLLEDLIPLLRKNTFLTVLHDKDYIPKESVGCRWYRKPVNGSCGNDITIHKVKPNFNENYVTSPEVCSELLNGYKYDWRLWICICSDGSYHICLPAIQRLSYSKFSLLESEGAITNIAKGSQRIFHSSIDFIDDVHKIVSDVIDTCLVRRHSNRFMLTGWDFITDKSGVKLLEINSCPGMDTCHQLLMDDFLQWIYQK